MGKAAEPRKPRKPPARRAGPKSDANASGKDESEREPKLRSFLREAEGLDDGAAELVGRVESYRESTSGSAVLDGALDVAAKKLSAARKQASAAHLALLGAIAAAEMDPPDEQQTLMPECEDGE